MILITGTDLEISDLPNNDMIEYQIENKNMNIKLKSVAKSPTCFQIYIAEDKRTDYTITDELAPKIMYFKSDDDLIHMLENGQTSVEKDIFEETIEEKIPVVDVPVFEAPKPVVKLEKPDVVDEKEAEKLEEKSVKNQKKDKKETESIPEDDNITDIISENIESESLIPRLDLEVAETELPESFLQIPNVTEDVDSLKVQLETKDKIIAQKDAMIREHTNNIDQIWKTQEIQLTEIQEACEQKIAEANQIIEDLKSKVTNASLEPDAVQFLKFINYAQSYKAVVKEEFTEDEKKNMGKLNSKYTVFASGSGDSFYSMLKQVRKYIDKSPDVIILDFTNDNYLAGVLKMNSKSSHTFSLLKDDINPVTLLREVNGVKIIPTTNFNDIAFLNINWVELLRKIDDMAGGKQVIMLFGSINNFNIRYTISKLATLMPLYVFVKSSPILLTTLYSDIAFIPKARLSIVAVEYIEMVKNILTEISKIVPVLAFEDGKVEWNKLGLKK